MSRITTHVIDGHAGQPGRGIRVTLSYREPDGGWGEMAAATTDANGRIDAWTGVPRFPSGTYWLRFASGAYFAARQIPSLYPSVVVELAVDEASHYHVPLLLGPHGYTTYRGS
jgi:5-hydroxyisourate hydrolase